MNIKTPTGRDLTPYVKHMNFSDTFEGRAPEYTPAEQDCKGCLGPCGYCDEAPYHGNTNVLGHIIWTCIGMLLLYAGMTIWIRGHSIEQRTAGSSEHARYEARR